MTVQTAAQEQERVDLMRLLSTILILTTCFLGSIPLRAQTIKKWTPAEIIAKAKPGQWVEIDGAIQKDQSVRALEVEFRTGDFMADDWKLLAKVRAVNPATNEFQVLSVPVKVTKDTEFEDGIKSVSDIKPEMLVKLEGTYLNDGIFLAKEVEDRNKKLKTDPEFDTMLEVVGKVGQADEVKRIITVMGIQFHITEETEGKSLIK